MVEKAIGETRLHYLMRVAIEFAKQNEDSLIDYDEVTCDGLCLAEELETELEWLEHDEVARNV